MKEKECDLDDSQMDSIGALMTRRAREIASYAKELKRLPADEFCKWFNGLRESVQLVLYELDVIEKAAAGKPIEFEKPSWAVETIYPVEFEEEAWKKAVPSIAKVKRDAAALPLFAESERNQR